MMEKELSKPHEESKAKFTLTVVLLKLLLVASIIGLIWLIDMLFMNGDGFKMLFRGWSWR